MYAMQYLDRRAKKLIGSEVARCKSGTHKYSPRSSSRSVVLRIGHCTRRVSSDHRKFVCNLRFPLHCTLQRSALPIFSCTRLQPALSHPSIHPARPALIYIFCESSSEEWLSCDLAGGRAHFVFLSLSLSLSHTHTLSLSLSLSLSHVSASSSHTLTHLPTYPSRTRIPAFSPAHNFCPTKHEHPKNKKCHRTTRPSRRPAPASSSTRPPAPSRSPSSPRRRR